MADIQAEIARVCRLLDSDKLTERKKNYVKIRSLLSEKETQKLLDVNSDSGKKNVVDWDFVFKYTQAYVNREMECLRNQKPRNSQTPSSTVANNREKKKKEIVALLKFVIKIADERERYRLNGKDVVQHIITILVNQDMNGMFVADYQNIFLKYILTSKTYRCEITCKMWHDLIDIFAKMVTSSVGERSFSAKIFSYVIISASNQVDVKSSKLFTFFGNAFTDVRRETNSHVLEHLLGALISFSNAVAIDCRGHLCQLGEDLTPVLLYIWNKPHLVIKERLVQFMRLQVRLHHPDGVHCEKDGAWSTNSTYWKKCLQKIYEAISSEIQQISGRIRVQSSKLESGLKPPLIELAGDVCHQLFFPSVLPLDTKLEGPSPSKRRKLDVGWSALRDILTNGQETSALLAWLQITANILQKFPDDLPSKEYVPLLTSLHQLQMECKRQEIIASSMICLKFVALCHVQLIKDSVEEMSAKSTWKNIWHAALRSCSSHGLEDESFELLEIIVKQKLAEPDTEPWKLLTEAGCSSSVRSLQFLWFYLKTLPLPEHFYCNTQVFSTPPFQFYPLRHQLFDWILPPAKRVERQGGVASSCYSKILSRLPMELLSRVLVILTQRICHNNKSFVETFSVERNSSEQFEYDLKTMENLYMLSSLDKNAVTKLVDPVQVESNKCVSSDNNTVELLLDYLVKRLLEISETLLKTPDCESNSSLSSPPTPSAFPDKRVEVLTRYCSLSTKVMGLLLYFNAFSTGELTSSSLHQTTMRIVKIVASEMSKSLRHKDEPGKLMAGQAFTAALSDFLLCPSPSSKIDRKNACYKSMMEVVKSVTPKELIDCLLQVITSEPRHLNKSRLVVDEFDGSYIENDVEMDDFQTDDFQSPILDQKINQDNFSEHDKLRIGYMEILSTCLCASYDSRKVDGLVGNVQSFILDYFESEDFDVVKPLHSKLLFSAAFILGCGRIKPKHFLIILQKLRHSISKFRKDQEYCREGLRLMTVLAKQFAMETEDEEDMKEARELILHLLKAFWNLRETNYQSSVRLQLAKCMDALIRFDPNKKWAFFELRNNNNVSLVHISHVFPQLLCDPSHQVRMYMAEAIGILFLKFNSENMAVPENPVIQDELFDIVADALAKALVVERDLANTESEDEGNNRACSLLSAFKNIATVSCWCEPKVVCLLLQATKEQKLNQELVAKVIQQISVTIGYQSTHQFIKTHIGRVIDSWLNHGFQLVDFPFQALGFKSLADFLRTHHASIMPHLIWRFNDKASLKTIGREIGNKGDWTEFLVLDFCQIMSIIVPRFAEQSCQTNNSDGVFGLDRRKELDAEKQKAYDCHGFLETVLQKEITDKLMVNKFDGLIVELLLRMHDAPSELSDVSQFLRDYDPPTDKPHFTSHAIKATLDYLTKCHDGSNTLVSILCKRKENIQKILLMLSEHLEETHVFHKRRSFLAMYRLFVLLLLQELNTGLAGTWAFVVRDIVYTLIRIISTNNAPNILMINGMTRDEQINIQLDGDLFTASCDLLYQVCKVALSCCSQEIGHHLLVIANEITPFVSKNDNRAKKAVALLRFLIVDNKSSLQSAISLLDPFPDQPEFAVFNEAYWSVRQNTHATGLSAEIDHYLLISSRCPTASRLEGLRYLCSRFEYYKNELQDATRIDLNGSSLGVKLMKLLRYLIKLCKKSTSEVKVEVGKLFAEVGLPVLYVSFFNLTTSEAEDENNSYTKACEVFRGDEEKCRNCRILHILNHCLIDRSIKKVAAAASCLRDIFEKRTILTMMKTYQEQKIDHLFGYLEPFKPGKRQKTSEQSETPKASSLEKVLKDSDLWSPGNFNCHDEWISALTSAIILSGGVTDEVLKCLAPICKVHSSFADRIFPYLIHDVLSSHGEAYRVLLSEQIRRIFSSHVLSCSNQSRASTPLITAAENSISNAATHDSIHSVLNVVNYLRKQPRPKLGKSFTTSWESNFWLDLNFLELAEAALKSSGYCTAILYIEIWRDIQRASSSSSVENVCSDEQYIPMEVCSESTDESQETNYQTILFEAYASIGEPDAVYGSGMSTDLKARIHTYEQEKCWGKALRAYDIHCRQSDNQPCVGTIQALQTFGLEHVTYRYLKGLGDENQEEFLELQYESAWRNRIWTIEKDISDKFSVNNRGFNKCVYDSIQSLRNKEFKLFRSSINECRLQIVEDLCRTNTESLWEVYPRISRLQCLVELEQAENICERSDDHEILLNNWIVNMPESFSEFLEPILSLRSILLQELLTLSQNDETTLEKKHSLIQGIMKHNEMVSKLARHAGRYQISEKAIITLKDLQKTGENALSTSYSWKIEEAKVFWFQGEHETAMRLLRQINYVIKHEPMISKLLYAQTLGLYGSWLAETRSENSNTIMEKYLEKAVELVESCNDKQESTIEAFLSLARFADSQYKNIQDYMKSWAFENKQTIMNKLKSEISDLKDLGHEKGRYIRELSLQSQSDELELTQLKEDRLKYLQKAIKNYIKCLQVGGKYDLKMFRICSLWMENSNDDSINEIVKQGIFTKAGEPLTESRKFLPLMYQLAARLGARTHSNELFQKTLTKLICQAAIDHPHHVIWIILALCNAAKDNKYLNCGKKSSRLSRTSGKNQVNSYVDEDRVKAARAVIEIVRSSQRDLVSSMEKLSEAYIELAYYDVSQHKNNTGPLSLPELALKRISNLRNVALPTADIQIDPTCRYQDIVSVAKFDPKYQLCGGINLPKILLCIGSDGVKRRQLIKGKDDLRQDAVMQQVFGMVNTLLQKNVETRKRNLKIRTYKVVPLSQRSGLVEWCEETTPLGNYLIGGQARMNGAHQRYNPKDWSSLECRKKIQVEDRSNVDRRFAVYKELTAHFHPVFRHFFLEKFPDPSIWFEKRLGYTRSVATASIVGYIVGLGDRHVQNILIDCNTAELIHIDLGVAFEQGKMLPTPETVPFRLTRDLVDGMGISGVEGVFRRCCEKTMEVMRTSQEALLTIVEVLLYDPLYVWTVSPLKAMELQRAHMDTSDVPLETGNEGEARERPDETSVNKMAERVLVRLGQKLDGIEDGTLLSVKGQVNHLIREAKDPKNLCRLFPGWQPWI